MIKKRYSLLDLLRWIAAIMVATSHWTLEIDSQSRFRINSIPILGDLVANGGLGVTIFFILSGYVIIETAMKRDALDFIFARFNRLFPGLIICMPLVLLIGSRFITKFQSPTASLFNSIFLTFDLTGIPPLASQLWTLVIEVQFYGIVALLLVIFPKLFKKRERILFFLIGWQALVIILGSKYWFESPQLSRYLTLGGYANLFAFGICLNVLSNSKIKNIVNFLPSLGLTFYFATKVFGSLYDWSSADTIVLTAAFIILISKFVNFKRKSSQKIFEWLGLSSYPVYLIHVHIGMAFLNIFRSHTSANIYVVFFVSILFITGVCILLSLYVEKPIQALGRFIYGNMRRVSSKILYR